MKKLLKKIYLLLVVVFALQSIDAQTISAYSISGAAGYFNQNVSLDYNIGQIVMMDNNYFFSAFIEHSVLSDSISSKKIDDAQILINCFPNPTSNIVNISITSKYQLENINLSIYNSTGIKQKIFFTVNNRDKYSILQADVTDLKTGIYSGTVQINNIYIKNFSFIKN
ncbi:MAG: hypothetical protein JXR68_00930 [Bacteroidales bacterium]|nr:hypothetical protein [Bacteroidales bacterium]